MTARDSGNRFVVPALVLLFLVTVYPVVFVIYLSTQRRLVIFEVSEFVGAGNFLFMMNDGRFWNALKNTLYFTALSVPLEVLLGLCIAVLIHRSFRLKGIARAVVLIPWAVPTVVSAKMWEWIYNADYGILNHLLGADINWLGDPFWAMHAAIIMDVWKTTPFAVILFSAGLQIIPAQLLRAARIDGAGAWQAFRRITLPLLSPVILVVFIFRTLDAFRVFDAVYVLTGGGPANTTETLSIYAYRLLFQTLQFGYGSAVSLVVFFAAGCISVFYIRLLTKGGTG